MAANRADNFAGALKKIWGRGGVLGCKSLEKPTNAAIRMLTAVTAQSTKDSSHGRGLKPQPKAPSSSLWLQKPNTTPNPLGPPIS